MFSVSYLNKYNYESNIATFYYFLHGISIFNVTCAIYDGNEGAKILRSRMVCCILIDFCVPELIICSQKILCLFPYTAFCMIVVYQMDH